MITNNIEAIKLILKKEKGFMDELEKEVASETIHNLAIMGMIKRGYEADMRGSWEASSAAQNVTRIIKAGAQEKSKSLVKRAQKRINRYAFKGRKVALSQ